MLHIPTGTIGVAKHYYDGVVEKFFSPGDPSDPESEVRPVNAPVLMVGENSFIASEPEKFSRLTTEMVFLYQQFSISLGNLLKVAMTMSAQAKVEPDDALTIFQHVLREQLTKLRAA